MKDITPIEQKPNNRFIAKNDKVYKSLRQGIVCGPDWLRCYKKIYERNKNLVKVYDVVEEGKMIVMEKLDIICTLNDLFMEEKYQHLITKDLICDIINVLCTSWAIDFDFSKSIKGDEYFVYTDLKLSNLVLTKDHKIKYIDPDAYGFIPELDNAHRFIQVHVELMHRVQRYYNKIKNV
tara:strand:- start:55 stop:591 length:537 start_codon:yes stop_codon:yes gene_type:complete